uniref:Uncharacterized protein n=1 Tax=Vitis vinifera TaxID=29760 RepID=F6HPD8_VITVI
MNLGNSLEVVVHHNLLIGGMTDLDYQDGFLMVSVCISVYGYTLDKTYELDYEGTNTPMSSNGPRFELIYHDGKVY